MHCVHLGQERAFWDCICMGVYFPLVSPALFRVTVERGSCYLDTHVILEYFTWKLQNRFNGLLFLGHVIPCTCSPLLVSAR
jgi:hypothetical protein